MNKDLFDKLRTLPGWAIVLIIQLNKEVATLRRTA